jgi:hypothetical protein
MRRALLAGLLACVAVGMTVWGMAWAAWQVLVFGTRTALRGGTPPRRLADCDCGEDPLGLECRDGVPCLLFEDSTPNELIGQLVRQAVRENGRAGWLTLDVGEVLTNARGRIGIDRQH